MFQDEGDKLVIDRRTLLGMGAGTLGAIAGGPLITEFERAAKEGWAESETRSPANIHSIVPVVGDGKWIWTEPPKEETGYLEPREFDVTVGIRLTGRGDATNLAATTVAPVETAEQKIDDVKVETDGCRAGLRQLGEHAGQLLLNAPGIRRDQVIRAEARYRLTLHKDFRALEPSQFPAEQLFARDFIRLYGAESPGIEVRNAAVRRLAREVAGQLEHPWEKAKAFYLWVRENIEPRLQAYTSVSRALRDRVGDCEECAAVFVALCRASGIPARLVWVPGHNWAEFCLHDENDEIVWIPAHTAAYSWFGWTGVHEVILQKGDRIRFPEKREDYRLLVDWMQWEGRKPEVYYYAEIAPVAKEGDTDPGPGARRKELDGRWVNVGRHARARFSRQ